MNRRFALFGFSLFPIVGDAFAADPTGSNTDFRPQGTAGGDLLGTYPNPTVAQINGTAIGPAATALLGQIPGVTGGTAANAGSIGEYTTASLGSASAVALVTTGTVTSIVSVTLAAGDWDVWGSGFFQGSSSAILWGTMAVAVSNASNALPNLPAGGVAQLTLSSSGVTSIATTILPVTHVQFIGSAAMTAWLVAKTISSAGVASCTAYGIIQARRMR